MSYRLIADNGNSAPHGMTLGRRLHLARWLLLGWAMFGLISVLEPCCRNLAAQDAVHAAAAQGSGNATDSENSDCGAHQENSFCQSLSVAEINPPDTSAAVSYRINVPFGMALAALLPLLSHARAVTAYTPTERPASGAPLYLRHQRLLI